MEREPRCRPEVMVLGPARRALAEVARALRQAGARPRAALGLDDARRHLLRAGAIDLLVIAADVTPAGAQRVAAALRALAPTMPIVVFGRELLTSGVPGVHRIHDLHLRSRAGLGALRRQVLTLNDPD